MLIIWGVYNVGLIKKEAAGYDHADSFFTAGRIPGTVKKGDLWLIPADAEKPADGRMKSEQKKSYKLQGKYRLH